VTSCLCVLVVVFQVSVQSGKTSMIAGNGEAAEVAEVAGWIVFVLFVVGAVLGYLRIVVLVRSWEGFQWERRVEVGLEKIP